MFLLSSFPPSDEASDTAARALLAESASTSSSSLSSRCICWEVPGEEGGLNSLPLCPVAGEEVRKSREAAARGWRPVNDDDDDDTEGAAAAFVAEGLDDDEDDDGGVTGCFCCCFLCSFIRVLGLMGVVIPGLSSPADEGLGLCLGEACAEISLEDAGVRVRELPGDC